MLAESIKIGDRLEITLKREKSLGKSYVSQVENILDNQRLVIHVPISYGQLIKLRLSENYSFLFFTEKGMIRFDAAVTAFSKVDGFDVMTIKLVSEGEKIQRRDFFRFSCLLPLKFSIMNEKAKEQDEQPVFEGVIKDLGGGGIRFVANEPIVEDAKIKCVIVINDEFVVVMGKVLHKQYFPKSIYKYQYRAVFIGILPKEQEEIVQFIFAEQRRNLQKTNM